MIKARKAVITGGAGFIGSHLAEELADRGYQVVILDDLSTGTRENIEALLSGDKADFVLGSIADLPLLQKLFAGSSHVFHLAAVTSVPRSLESPLAAHEVNATGTLNVLLAARDNGIGKVVYASSCAVYGDTPLLPQREDMPPLPLSPYAVAKLAGEYYCRAFNQVYGLPTACLRFFNVYGPRQDPASQYAAVIPRFISRLASGKPAIIFGDGEQTRDFIYVKDVAQACIQAAESELNGIFNIGSGKNISINALAQLITDVAGLDIRPVHEAPRAGDIVHSLADISRARGFGYQPKYSLEAGLKQTLKGFNLAAT